MEDSEKLSNEIRIPECSVQQLARFVNDKTSPTISNYSMLIGSGCSVTSNVKSGEDLIKDWQKQVYYEYTNDFEDIDIEKKVEEFFKSSKFEWYDNSKAYQTLFEHLYPIKELRRKFVEKEIEDEKVFPGIGYSGLIKLAQKNNIDTFFTTNFDDLINEAFYIYGGLASHRPVVCSHEASIDSISITQQHPKIIKLHGDYLFENIKTTTDDTSKLKDNMSKKFSEFAKEKGLVIVGYSGNDDSIIDAIEELAIREQQNYFKPGIFWCVRKGSKLNDKVLSLLSKINDKEKRAWIVQIDGFDEFVCELIFYLNHGEEKTSLGFYYYSDSNEDSKIVKFYSSNNYYKETKSKYLKNRYHTIMNSFKPKSNEVQNSEENDEPGFKGIQRTSDKKFAHINELISSKQYEEAVSEIKQAIGKENNSDNRYEFNQLLAFSYNKLNNNAQACSILEQLTNERPFDSENYYNLSVVKTNTNERIESIDNGLGRNPTDLNLLNRKGNLLLREFEYSIVFSKEKEKELEEVLKKGVFLSNGIENPCWQTLFSYYLRKAERDNDYSSCEDFLNLYSNRFDNDYRTVSLKVKLMKSKKEKSENIFSYLKSLNIDDKDPDLELFDSMISDVSSENNDFSYLVHFLTKKYEYRMISSTIDKASFLLNKFRNPQKALDLLRKYLEKTNSENVANFLVDTLLLLKETDEAEDIIEQYSLSKKRFEDKILENRGDWEKVAEIEKKRLDNTPLDERSIMAYSHALLWLERFNDVKSFLQEKLQPSNFSNQKLLINYTIAKKATRDTVKNTDSKRLNLSTEDSLENCALLLICAKDDKDEKKKKAKEMLSRIITKDYSDYYYSKSMYVFSKNLKASDWEDILRPLNMIPEIDEELWGRIVQSVV